MIPKSVIDATRPLRRNLAYSIYRFPLAETGWAHTSAQQYEHAHNLGWLKENLPAYRAWLTSLTEDDRSPDAIKDFAFLQFFRNDPAHWRAYVDHLVGKTILEVGPGPMPLIAGMRWAARRICIDPLLSTYDRDCKQLGDGWSPFDGIELIDSKIESFIPSLAIDGAIWCRNVLDHLEYPGIALSNLASYARPGCMLFFWTDVLHPEGGDAGHHDIAPDLGSIARLVTNLGFSIVREAPAHVPGWEDRAWGCVAVKR
jgi:hypothetical protein